MLQSGGDELLAEWRRAGRLLRRLSPRAFRRVLAIMIEAGQDGEIAPPAPIQIADRRNL